MGSDQTRGHTSSTDVLSHEEVGGLLHAYAHEVLMGGGPEERFPAVAAHLAQCAACRAELDELLEVTRAVYSADEAPVSSYPSPDLSRLPRPWQKQNDTDRPWFIDRFRRLWLEFSQPLLQAWQPSPLLGSARGMLLFAYRQEGVAEDPSVSVEVYAEDDPAMALVCVTIDVPGRNALDQSGMPAVLYVGGTLRRAATDTSGTVSFSQVPRDALASLQIAVTLDQSA